jgi:hypothetical protein
MVEELLLIVNRISGSHVTEQSGEFVKCLLFAVQDALRGSIGLVYVAVGRLLGRVLDGLDRPAHVYGELHRVLPDHDALEPAVRHLDVDTLLEFGLVGEADARQLLLHPGPVHPDLGERMLVCRLDEPQKPLAHGVRALLDRGC